MSRFGQLAVAALIAVVPVAAGAQDPPGQDPPAQQDGGGRGGRAQEPQIRPYERVITPEAKSDEGIFTVHRIKDRLYYEVPKDRLGREFAEPTGLFQANHEIPPAVEAESKSSPLALAA